MNICIIGIGSNINSENNISRIIDILGKDTKLIKVSTFVKTHPIGIKDQPDFLNGAVKIETNLHIHTFRNYLKSLENQMGRDRSQPKDGPRCIDLDIVIWNGKIVDEDYYTRDFLRNAVLELGL